MQRGRPHTFLYLALSTQYNLTGNKQTTAAAERALGPAVWTSKGTDLLPAHWSCSDHSQPASTPIFRASLALSTPLSLVTQQRSEHGSRVSTQIYLEAVLGKHANLPAWLGVPPAWLGRPCLCRCLFEHTSLHVFRSTHLSCVSGISC